MKRRQLLKVGAALLPLFTLPVTAMAADYPDRDIRVVVPWGAGGGVDGIMRKITTLAEDQIEGSTFYVENVEGGVSATGVGQVMAAKPDGYTIGAATYDSLITVPWQNMLPTYKLDKLKLIARITSEPDAIVVDANSDYNTVQDLIDAAKANPGKIRVAIQNLGSRVHLTLLQLQNETGTEFKIIAYPGGSAPQKEAILSDEVDVAITSLGDFSTLIEDSTVRGLVEFTDTKNPTYDVPTSTEAGLKVMNGSFIVLAAPAGTPDDIVATLETAYKAAYDSAEFQDWLKEIGVTPAWLGTAEVSGWAEETEQGLYKQMDALAEQGVLSR